MRTGVGFDKVLVTGGAGFIGSHTVDALLERGLSVWVIDNLSTGTLRNLKRWKGNPNFHFAKGDVTKSKPLRDIAGKVEAIVHLAALVSPKISVANPELANDVNVSGTLKVLQAALRRHVEKVVFASSSSVYGNSTMNPIPENAALDPISPYGVSKLAAEKYCRAYHVVYGLKTVSLRYLNVYGERQSSNPYSGVIAIFARNLLDGKRPKIFGDGRQTRDFIHVSDVVNANLLALRSKQGVGGSFNIGTGQATSIRELYQVLASLIGIDLKPVFAQRRPGDIEHSCARIDRATKILGFRPRLSLQAGLRLFVRSLQQ